MPVELQAMTIERDIRLPDGRAVHVFDGGAPEGTGSGAAPVILWHHGSPQSGAILAPLAAAAARRGIRLISAARPSYGGSSPNPGRTVASAAADHVHVLDALGIERFGTMGASGGGPHALAVAALMPGRCSGVVAVASPAPFSRDFDWFAGMAAPGGLRSARDGREARAWFATTDEFDPGQFVDADWAALRGTWRSLGEDAGPAGEQWPDGLIDDDCALVEPWGFDLAAVAAPVLLVQGSLDRVIPGSHAGALLRGLARGELWIRPRDGHISVLDAVPVGMDWLLAQDGR